MYSTNFCKQCVYILEGPWNECQKSFCLFRLTTLYFSYFNKVFKPFFNCFHVTEHHGGRCCNIQLVRFMHNIKPFLCSAFSFADQSSHTINKDFRSCTRQRIKSSFS